MFWVVEPSNLIFLIYMTNPPVEDITSFSFGTIISDEPFWGSKSTQSRYSNISKSMNKINFGS